MDPADVRRAITPKTRLIIINSPQNPTGAVLTKEQVEEFAAIAEEYDVYLLSDEMYSKIIYDGEHHHSATRRDRCRERTILLNGFSKAYAMTGWRVGYAVGPADVIAKMALYLETIVSCLPPFVQRGAIAALEGDQAVVAEMVESYRARRELMVDGLNSLPGVSCLKPGGAFYAFANIRGTGMTSEQFSEFMLAKAGVALLPGNHFGEGGEGFVRLCYASSREAIELGIERMRQQLEDWM